MAIAIEWFKLDTRRLIMRKPKSGNERAISVGSVQTEPAKRRLDGSL